MTGHAKCAAWASALLSLTFQLVGCASAPDAFAVRYPDNLEPEVSEMIARAQKGAGRDIPAIAAGVTTSGNVFAYDLGAKRVAWQVPGKTRFAPLLAGQSVVIQEGTRIVGLDIKTGAARFQFDAGEMHLVGADGAGDRSVLTLTSGQGTYAKSRVVFMQAGVRRWTHDLNTPVGVPALTGDTVLVPWSNQYLSGLDAANGDEYARLRLRKGVVSHAFVSNGHVFVGSQNGIALLSKELLVGALTNAPHYDPPQEELPGRPAFLRDAYSTAPLPTPDSAHSRVRLSWQSDLTAARQISMAGDSVYLIFYRFVFALDPRSLELRWAHTHDVDLVGARAETDGIVIADSQGALTYLAATSGAPLWREQNGPPSVSLEFPSDQRAIGGANTSSVVNVDLRKQLAAAALDPDARLVPMRLLAVKLLAKLPDPAATADLLTLCEDERTTVGIRKAACNALRERSVGNEHVLRALQRHGSYLAATSAPPVGALAKAATTQKEARAAPLLIAHLRDPNTPTQGLSELVQALGELGDQAAVPALTQFFLLYHADPVDEHLARALTHVPDALVRLQGAAAHDVLQRVADDPLGAETARNAAQKALGKLEELAKTGTLPEPDPSAADPAADEAAAAPKEKRPPDHITVDIIKQVLLPVHDPLQACIREAKPDVFQARAVLVIEDGQVLMVSVLPEQLQSCIEPLIRSQQFPLTHLSQRDRITYVIKRF
ncbi:MAG: PQQ-binding-like beta-propeller repeat protein [Polyangiales bacterium]